MDELYNFCQTIKSKFSNGEKLSIDHAREIVKSINNFLYSNYEGIGKSNCTVSKYINQKVQPDLKTLNQIADILQVDVKDLLVSNVKAE